MGRYGTLVNKQALNGQEATLKEGDFLQFGHKSSFRSSSCCIQTIATVVGSVIVKRWIEV